jgi:hypothetical protein
MHTRGTSEYTDLDLQEKLPPRRLLPYEFAIMWLRCAVGIVNLGQSLNTKGNISLETKLFSRISTKPGKVYLAWLRVVANELLLSSRQ